MSNIRFVVTIYPNGGASQSITIEKFSGSPSLIISAVENTNSYTSSIDGTFTTMNKLCDGVYDFFKTAFIDTSCTDIRCDVQEICDDLWNTIQRSIIKRSDIKLCKYKCSVEFKLTTKDIWSCVRDNWETSINFYGLPKIDINATTNILQTQLYGNIEAFSIQVPNGSPPPISPLANIAINDSGTVIGTYSSIVILPAIPGSMYGTVLPDVNSIISTTTANLNPFNANEYCLLGSTTVDCAGDPLCNPTDLVYWYGREIGILPCQDGEPVPPPSMTALLDNWQLVGSLWAPLDMDCSDNMTKWWRCPSVLQMTNPFFDYTKIKNNYLFNDVLKYVVTTALASCGVSCVTSNFFNINPQNDYPSNNAYSYANTYLKDLTLSQKSNIKTFISGVTQYANSSNYAFTLKELLENIQALFNISYDFVEIAVPNIIGVIELQLCMRIEHVSFYDISGIANVENAYQAANSCCIKYSSELTRYQSFTSMDGEDATNKPDFKGGRLIDFLECTKGDTEHSSLLIDTDISYIITNPDGVSNEGFVLCSTYTNDNIEYFVFQAVGALSNNVYTNAHLSWANLVDAYWRHNANNWSADYIGNADDTVYSVTYNLEIENEISMPTCSCDFDELNICFMVTRASAKVCAALNSQFKTCYFSDFGYAKLSKCSVSLFTGNGSYSYILKQQNI